MPALESLFIVMPVYNEADAIHQVVSEWLTMLNTLEEIKFTFCLLNDGSRDATPDILNQLAQAHSTLHIIHKSNSGHGQTCLHGYHWALAQGATWILQLDSDGQCDPIYFDQFWAQRHQHRVIYGYRKLREDGALRYAISRVVSLVGWLGSGIWVLDANVPYRLMQRDTLEAVLPQIPSNFFLVNALLALLQQQQFGIRWVPIRFRQRSGGHASIQGLSFARQGFRYFQQLRQLRF